MKIYLASKSPRRQELLKMMGVEFDLLWSDTPENPKPDESPDAYSLRVTEEKLVAAWQKIIDDALPTLPVLCADNEVDLDGEILGKPKNYEDAFRTLQRLSGRKHRTLTTVGVKYNEYQKLITNVTQVTFAEIPRESILH